MKEVTSIRWPRGAIKHIARHNIEPSEIEEALFEVIWRLKKGGYIKRDERSKI